MSIRLPEQVAGAVASMRFRVAVVSVVAFTLLAASFGAITVADLAARLTRESVDAGVHAVAVVSSAALGEADGTVEHAPLGGSLFWSVRHGKATLATGTLPEVPGALTPGVVFRPAGPVRVDRSASVIFVSRTFEAADIRSAVAGFERGDQVVVSVVVPKTAANEAFSTLVVTGFRLLAVSVVAVALLVWVGVGRVLHPVEELRTTAEIIGAGQGRGHRVAVPRTRELAALAVTLNSMLDRLEASEKRQQAFVSDASHELRSPVSTLTAVGELGLRASTGKLDGPCPAPEELFALVQSEAARLERLVAELLDLARIDEGAIVPDAEEVDIDGLCAAEAARARVTYPQVAIDGSGIGPARVRGDVLLLEGVVRNLVDNACRHASTKVSITCRQNERGVTVVVDDDGPGIEPADRERIFERFARTDESRTRHSGGVGLGLSLAYEVVSAHRGAVRCDRSPMGGARFVVELPVCRAGT